jgi:hypothetical protein
MPNTEGLKILVRKQPITDDDWFRLIEARCSLLKSHLNSFTFSELGSFNCLRSGLNETHAIWKDNETGTIIGDHRVGLDTQGIFCCPKSSIERIPGSGYQAPPGGVSCPDGKLHIWGFTRYAEWILVTVEFKGESGYKCGGYERAGRVYIEEVDLETIIAKTKTTPEEIWRELGRAIRNGTERRRELYENALGIARTVEIEESVLSLRKR